LGYAVFGSIAAAFLSRNKAVPGAAAQAAGKRVAAINRTVRSAAAIISEKLKALEDFFLDKVGEMK